ncbi:NAD-binding protein [Caminibacter pacificus]
MELLIVGAGKVGYFLAKALNKNHNVTIIDKNEKALEKIIENLDVLTVNKDIRDPNISHYLNDYYDYLINVTNNDEINIISDLILKNKLEIKHSVIRLGNTDYVNSPLYKILNARLIFPYILSARGIARLMDFPKANNIKTIPFCEFSLVSITADTTVNVSEINSENVLVIGVERDEKFIFLKEKDFIIQNDLVYIIGDLEKIKQLAYKINQNSPDRLEKITIFGANDLAITIAKLLNEFDIKIKIVEKEEDVAKKAADILPENIEIIHMAYEDDEILINEGVHHSDAAITAYLHDEDNIIKSLKARKLGIKKIITINNNLNYYSIMHSLKLSTIRGPKIAAFYEILEEIDSQFLIYERFFLGMQGKIFIKKVFKAKKIEKPKEYAKVIVIREDKIFEVKDTFEVKEDDIIVEFNFSGNRSWIEEL